MSRAPLHKPVTSISAYPPFAERLLRRWLDGWTEGGLVVVLPNGETISISGDGPAAVLSIHNLRFLWRVLASGSVGFAEGYIAGEWDSPDLALLLTLAAKNMDAMERRGTSGTPAARLIARIRHSLRANTRAGSRRNIAAHYDLGNAFYASWLDPSMSYSSALFEDPSEEFELAQRRKYHRLCEMLGLKGGMHVLEIGCGWGGFAEIAAREYGCRVTALTVSPQQATFARSRMQRLGLEDKVDIRLEDYRDVNGRFDADASIEMFEAVGAENWPIYFDTLQRVLAPHGRAAIQTITIADAKLAEYKRSPDFIQRYIFPGGMLPSPSAFRGAARAARFELKDECFFGSSYTETLRRWRAGFNAQWTRIVPMGFDERFRRTWNYYLCYCEAGFANALTDVGQFLLVRGADASRSP